MRNVKVWHSQNPDFMTAKTFKASEFVKVAEVQTQADVEESLDRRIDLKRGGFTVKVWITKFALTQGILERDVEVTSEHPRMAVYHRGYDMDCFHKPFWHETLSEAVDHAEKLRENKIKSLQKQIQKLKDLKF